MFYFVKCQSGERRDKLVKRILNLDQQPCPSFDVTAGGMFRTPPVIRWALEEWTRFICPSCLFNDSDGTKENRGVLFLEDSSSKAQLSVFDYIHSQSEYYISTPCKLFRIRKVSKLWRTDVSCCLQRDNSRSTRESSNIWSCFLFGLQSKEFEISRRVVQEEWYENLNITICISKLTKCATFCQNLEFIWKCTKGNTDTANYHQTKQSHFLSIKEI